MQAGDFLQGSHIQEWQMIGVLESVAQNLGFLTGVHAQPTAERLSFQKDDSINDAGCKAVKQPSLNICWDCKLNYDV